MKALRGRRKSTRSILRLTVRRVSSNYISGIKLNLSLLSPGSGQSEPVRSWQSRDQPRKREKSEVKDYNKHWLIQEAEQRRISEAKQKQNLSTSSSSTKTSSSSQGQIDKLENLNNNQRGFGEKRAQNTISESNIYANVDPSNISYSSDPR